VNMNTGLSPNDPTIEAAFRTALLHQGLIAAGILVLLWLVWGASRNWVPMSDNSKKPGSGSGSGSGSGFGSGLGLGSGSGVEPRGRRVLRIGFGLLWLFDGILQAQPQMAAGLPSQVVEPSAQGSPDWVASLVNWGEAGWSYHPVEAAAAAVWIQVGIGLWLLAAPRGRWSRLAGVASVAWGLVVWAFAESFGAILAPGLSWLTGAPGASLLYAVGGVLVALPLTAWRTRLPGRVLLGMTGVFLAGMAAVQAWPGNGFWQGGGDGPLASMAASMAQTPQPRFLARLVADFASFAAGNAFLVNMVVVVLLAALGVVFAAAALAPGAVSARAVPAARVAVLVGAVFCLAVWVLFQDFGFFGGLGTDPNSMIPTILLFSAGYLALTPAAAASSPAPAPAPESVPAPAAAAAPDAAPGPGSTSTPEPAWRRVLAAVSLSSVTAFGALAIVLLGAAPMAAASVNRTADPIIAEALTGYSPPLSEAAPDFRLTNQDGESVSLSSFRGKVVLLTFLDPVCTTDCTFMGQEFLQAGKLLAADRGRVELVGVAVNPVYYSQSVIKAFDQQEGLSALPDWEFLTGTPAQQEKAWKPYGIVGQVLPAGGMVAHNDIAFVINQSGQITQELDFDPGPGTSASVSSFASLLAGDAKQLLGAS